MHTIEDSTEKMEKERAKVEENEASLAEEEKVLERIRDSLKGLFTVSMWCDSTHVQCGR